MQMTATPYRTNPHAVKPPRDYRDLVIEELADSEADLREAGRSNRGMVCGVESARAADGPLRDASWRHLSAGKMWGGLRATAD